MESEYVDFYSAFVHRNGGIIDGQIQRKLKESVILIAGCGSVGGAAIEPLVRLGAQHFILAEPEAYELSNINRQNMTVEDVGKNKAKAFCVRIRKINPHVETEVIEDGITPENVDRLVKASVVVVDGVDVTTPRALRCKFELHQSASRQGVPVISGYDLAGLVLMNVYDFRKSSVQVLNGKVSSEEIDRMGTIAFLKKMIPIRLVPYEMVRAMRFSLKSGQKAFPQVVFAAQLFGSLASVAILDLLAGHDVKPRVCIDLNQSVRPIFQRIKIRLAWCLEIFLMLRELGE